MIKNIWPNGKTFAFTIIDDSDYDTIEKIRPIYDFLYDINMLTTKNVWVYPSRNNCDGCCLLDNDYKIFILFLKSIGYEIGLHGVGSGDFRKDEISDGIRIFNDIIGYYPNLHTNHINNKDGLYVGFNRYPRFFKNIYNKFGFKSNRTLGDLYFSDYFWGDISKKYIKYLKGNIYNCTNIFNYDNHTPYVDIDKIKYSNYWFSTSDGYKYEKFIKIIDKENIDKLIAQRGLCVISANFSKGGFVDINGDIDKTFKYRMEYIANRNGWFVPATVIFDYLLKYRGTIHPLSKTQLIIKELKYSIHKMFK